MAVSVNEASPWPARAAYVASTIFIGASGSINVTYGWAKGETLAGSITWAAVSAAVATVFALAWPALIRSLDDRRWSAALIACAALILALQKRRGESIQRRKHRAVGDRCK
jgi:drug/metabolite transporter (DMT)-like permease